MVAGMMTVVGTLTGLTDEDGRESVDTLRERGHLRDQRDEGVVILLPLRQVGLEGGETLTVHRELVAIECRSVAAGCRSVVARPANGLSSVWAAAGNSFGTMRMGVIDGRSTGQHSLEVVVKPCDLGDGLTELGRQAVDIADGLRLRAWLPLWRWGGGTVDGVIVCRGASDIADLV